MTNQEIINFANENNRTNEDRVELDETLDRIIKVARTGFNEKQIVRAICNVLQNGDAAIIKKVLKVQKSIKNYLSMNFAPPEKMIFIPALNYNVPESEYKRMVEQTNDPSEDYDYLNDRYKQGRSPREKLLALEARLKEVTAEYNRSTDPEEKKTLKIKHSGITELVKRQREKIKISEKFRAIINGGGTIEELAKSIVSK